jgi:hypothetical protein
LSVRLRRELSRTLKQTVKQTVKYISFSTNHYHFSKLSLCFAVGFSQRTFLYEKLGRITEKWLVKSAAGFFVIDITKSLMKSGSSNFLCL